MQYFCLFAIMLTLPAMQLGPASAQQKQSVNVEDLVTKVTVTGRLNVPLRKVMAIEAEWRPPRGLAAKPDNRIKLYVTRIGGKQF